MMASICTEAATSSIRVSSAYRRQLGARAVPFLEWAPVGLNSQSGKDSGPGGQVLGTRAGVVGHPLTGWTVTSAAAEALDSCRSADTEVPEGLKPSGEDIRTAGSRAGALSSNT